MSGLIKKTIKDNIITQSTKFKNDQEKIGEVISINKDDSTCVVSVVTRDGLPSIIKNVRVQINNEGLIPWFPKTGDYVRVSEQYRRYTIIGKIDISTYSDANVLNYYDIYSDDTGSGGGFACY
jgi:hypothetical protein